VSDIDAPASNKVSQYVSGKIFRSHVSVFHVMQKRSNFALKMVRRFPIRNIHAYWSR